MKLSAQAKQVIEELKSGPTTVSELEELGFDQSMVNRAILELEEKELIELEEEEEIVQKITEAGKNVAENGSPEYRLVEKLRENQPVAIADIENPDLAIGKGKQKNWIDIREGEVYLTEDGENAEDGASRKLNSENFDEELEDRGLIETNILVEKKLIPTEKLEELDLDDIEQEFDVEADVKTPRTGKRHFYKHIMDQARQTWLEMGFKEMTGEFVVPSFLCFDALYTPQDHPAREMQDTFFMETPESSDLSGYGASVENVKNTHENGWTTGSTGWDYDWSMEEAEKNVLRTHTTAVSARKLNELEKEDLPAKYFDLSRVFRNETVDRHHLAEFYQTDGIVVGEDLNFRNLKAYISEFFERMGFEEFRLIPSYYPYTEMGVEVQVFDEAEEEWIGLGGAGMFRPEVVKPMLGFEATVLAWGLGIGRIAMRSAELEDIRELYRNDIKLLEQTPKWRPENK
ncbi:phenylalanine--tRNA ligase subunit alpha [Candidatus Nanohalococcus occultus]|uniref:phenylalanine--tRNA ligase subunit alpha n=1 Tax=Candidatus Nanohalococcus occultus TaxID=2978047 RepID=UPI0039E07529